MRLTLDSRARRLLRRLPQITVYSALELLLLTLLAVQLARLVWASVTPVGPLGAWRSSAALGSASPPSLRLGGFDPFFRLGGSAPAAAVTSLAIQLFGVRVNEATGGGSAILSTPDGVQSSYAVGDEIMPGVVLAAVRDDGVLIRRGGVEEQIFLDQSVPATNATPVPGNAPAAVPTGAFAPRISGTGISGLTVTASPGPLLEAAGLRAGDVVVTLNGAAISSAADVQQLAQSATPGSRVSLGVERGGRIVPVSVEVPPR